MRSSLHLGVASFVAAVIVATAAPGCLPTDYLGFDPSLAPPADVLPTEVDGGGDAGGQSTTDGGVTCHGPDRQVPYHPPAAYQAACDASVIDELATCLAAAETGDLFVPLRSCLVPLNDGHDPTCLACLVTPAETPSWGPLVRYPGEIVRPNFGGCIERTLPKMASCSPHVDAVEQCVYVRECSCTRSADCPMAALSPCRDERDKRNACFTQYSPDDSGGQSAFAACHPKPEVDYWRRQLRLFCGR